MKDAMRLIISFFAFLAIFFFTYWVPFSLIEFGENNRMIAKIISLILAIAVAVFVWKKSSGASNGLATHIVLGGVIIGAISFLAGFIGPIILTPESNLGPLLGIFITGPAGFIVGLVAGGIYWKIKQRRKATEL